MAAKALPCPTMLRLLLDYDPETGVLTWKERKPWMFPAGEIRSGEQLASIWNAKHAGKLAGTFDGSGYRRICVNHRRIKSHRAAWAIATGAWPSGEIDHINIVRGDDRLENLRDVPRGTNLKNKRKYKNNTSGRTGVYYFRSSSQWHASIPQKGRNVSLGFFSNFEDACAARDRAEHDQGYHANHGT